LGYNPASVLDPFFHFILNFYGWPFFFLGSSVAAFNEKVKKKKEKKKEGGHI
jgi:hypothetical protein